jgi:hypothetical protein
MNARADRWYRYRAAASAAPSFALVGRGGYLAAVRP